MNTKMYDQFIQITQIDTSAVKSIFMHLANVTENINSTKFNSITLSLKNKPDYTLVYSLEKGSKIPIATYKIISLLFHNASYLTDDIIINIELTYYDKLYNIQYEDNKITCSDNLNFLFSDVNYFNFYTGIHDYSKHKLALFENLFEFIIKKELSPEVEGVFNMQFDKHYAGLNTNTSNAEANIVDNEILIEKLLKTKNEIFNRINILTQQSSTLMEEKSKLVDYAQNKEKYTLKYEGLKQDYKLLTEQSTAYFKNVNDLKKILDQINNELNNINIMFRSSNLPESEKSKLSSEQSFLIEKKTTFLDSLTEAEANLSTMTSMLQTTKQNMEATYADMDLINNKSFDEISNYDKQNNILKKEIEDLYLNSSSIDIELAKLNKESSTFSISREYAELKNKGSDEIEYSALKSSLQSAIIPSSINIVYKYIVNLFLYHLDKQDTKKITLNLLSNFDIKPPTFFEYNNSNMDEVIIV